jgi:hypothetical protein
MFLVPARCADQDVTTLDSLPLELEILPADDKAGTQLMVLSHTAKRLKNLEIQTDYTRVPTIFLIKNESSQQGLGLGFGSKLI